MGAIVVEFLFQKLALLKEDADKKVSSVQARYLQAKAVSVLARLLCAQHHPGVVRHNSGIVTSDSGQALKLRTMDRNTQPWNIAAKLSLPAG